MHVITSSHRATRMDRYLVCIVMHAYICNIWHILDTVVDDGTVPQFMMGVSTGLYQQVQTLSWL